METKGALKFKHSDEKGVMHYVTYKNEIVGLSFIRSLKIDYIDQFKKLEVSFDLKSSDFEEIEVKVDNNLEYVQEVYEYMLKENNTYFKDGFDGLCVLKFHKK